MDKKKMFLIMGGIILLTVFVAFYYVFNKSEEVLDDFDSNMNEIKELYDEYKEYLIPPVLAAVMYSLSGIVLALILNVDIMAGTKDKAAFIVMLISVLMVFLVVKMLLLLK